MNHDRLNYVKDYDGGTHMECYVHPTVPYMDQAEMFETQGQFLRERIADISTSKVEYPGLTEEALNNLEHHIDIPGAGRRLLAAATAVAAMFTFDREDSRSALCAHHVKPCCSSGKEAPPRARRL